MPPLPRRCTGSCLKAPTDLTLPLLSVPALNTEIPGVSFSVFCAEDDWRQVQVPISPISVNTPRTLTPVQQFPLPLRHTESGTCSRSPVPFLPHSRHPFEIRQKRLVRQRSDDTATPPSESKRLPPSCGKILCCGLPCTSQRIFCQAGYLSSFKPSRTVSMHRIPLFLTQVILINSCILWTTPA